MPSSSSSGDMWLRRLTFDGSISLNVREEWNAGIGGTVWQGSIIAGRWFASPCFTGERLRRLPPHARAIELGAGVTGVPSLVLAALASRTGCLSEIVVTDTEECMEGLEAAVRANAPEGAVVVVEGGAPGVPHASTDGWALPRSVVEAVAGESRQDGTLEPDPPAPPPPLPPGTAAAASQAPPPAGALHSHPLTLRVAQLDWADVTPTSLGGPFDLVLVADCVYHPPAMESLVAALRALTAPGGQAVLAFYERSRPAAAMFWPRLRCAFNITHMPASAYGCAGADDVGVRADGSPGPVVGMFSLERVSEGEFQARMEERRRKEPEVEAEEAEKAVN